MIQRRKLRTGDENNWPSYDAVWGYGDIEMDIDDKAELHMQVDKIEWIKKLSLKSVQKTFNGIKEKLIHAQIKF